MQYARTWLNISFRKLNNSSKLERITTNWKQEAFSLQQLLKSSSKYKSSHSSSRHETQKFVRIDHRDNTTFQFDLQTSTTTNFVYTLRKTKMLRYRGKPTRWNALFASPSKSNGRTDEADTLVSTLVTAASLQI